MRRLAIALVLAGAASASAQPGDASEAARLFLRGRELKTAGQTAEACELFDHSYRLDPATGTALNLADCLEERGELRRAWELFDRVAQDPQNGASRAQLARRRADALLARLATVVVAIADPTAAGLAIRLADQPVIPAPEIRVLVEPGDVVVTASVPGQPGFSATLHAAAGETVTVAVPALVAPEVRGPRRFRLVAGGLAAAGVVGLGASLGFGIAARGANTDAFSRGCAHTPGGVVCTGMDGPRLIHLAGARADLATGFAIGGAVLVGAAAAVFFTAPRESVRVAPIAGGGALGVGLACQF